MEEPRGERRARVPGGDDRIRLAVSDRAAREDERAVRLRAHGLDRLLVHRDRLCRLDELEALRVEPLRPVEDRLERVRGGLERARDDLVGPAVAAHGVDGDADGVSHGLRSRRSERLDFAPAVRLARRAHAVGLLRLVADRALVHARRLQAMRGPPLVAAGSSVCASELP